MGVEHPIMIILIYMIWETSRTSILIQKIFWPLAVGQNNFGTKYHYFPFLFSFSLPFFCFLTFFPLFFFFNIYSPFGVLILFQFVDFPSFPNSSHILDFFFFSLLWKYCYQKLNIDTLEFCKLPSKILGRDNARLPMLKLQSLFYLAYFLVHERNASAICQSLNSQQYFLMTFVKFE